MTRRCAGSLWVVEWGGHVRQNSLAARGCPADRTLMVEPDSAEPQSGKPAQRVRGVAACPVSWSSATLGGEGRIIERALVEPPVAAVERRWRRRRVLALTEASTRWPQSCSGGPIAVSVWARSWRATRGSVNFTATGRGRMRVKEMNATIPRRTMQSTCRAALRRLGFELTTEIRRLFVPRAVRISRRVFALLKTAMAGTSWTLDPGASALVGRKLNG